MTGRPVISEPKSQGGGPKMSRSGLRLDLPRCTEKEKGFCRVSGVEHFIQR